MRVASGFAVSSVLPLVAWGVEVTTCIVVVFGWVVSCAAPGPPWPF